MAGAPLLEAELARLTDDLRYVVGERAGLLREVDKLQGEVCKARRDAARAISTADRRTCDMRQDFNTKINGMQREIARLAKQVNDGESAKASARVFQLCQQRKLKAAQEQLQHQEEKLNALEAEYLGLQSENQQLQSRKQGWREQPMVQNIKAPMLVTAPEMTALQQRDGELQQQMQLVRELQDELRDVQLETCFARSQTWLANHQLQLSEVKQQQLLDQVSQLQNHSCDQTQHQQTDGDCVAPQALEAEIIKLRSEIQELKEDNWALQQQLQSNCCKVASTEKPSDDRKVLLDNIQSLEEKVALLESRLAKYQQVFMYQSEALNLYAPMPPFMAVPSTIHPSTVQADNRKREGCCAKCSGTSENDTVEALVTQTDSLDAAAGLRQELSDLKEQLSECRGRLDTSCDKLARKEAEVVSVNMTVSKLQQDRLQLEEQGQCAWQANQLLQEQVADLQRQLLQLQHTVSQLQHERALENHQHQQEVNGYKQMVVEQTAALDAAAGLRQQLTDLEGQYDLVKKQSSEVDGCLYAAYDDLAQKQAELLSASSSVTRLEHESLQLQMQGHCALLSNQLLREQVADLHCQLLQLHYMVSDLQQQQAQHLSTANEQALDTVRQQQQLPAVGDSSEPADEPSTPELGASSFAEAHRGLLQPDSDDGGASSSSSSQCDANSIVASHRPSSRGNRGRRAGRVVASAVAVVLGIVLSQRKAST